MVLTEMVKLSEEVKNFLDSKRKYDRETYDDILRRLLKKQLKGGLK